MKIRWVQVLSFLLLGAALSSCGVLEVGIERTPTPVALASAAPSATLPPPTSTPFPGKLKPGQPLKLIQLHMLGRQDGWAVGQVETDLNDHLFWTQDGGQTWQERTPPESLLASPPAGFSATAYFDASGAAWVTYVDQLAAQAPLPARQPVWRTADSGQTWQAGVIDLTGLQAEHFLPVHLGFLDEQHGWLLAHLNPGQAQEDAVVLFTSADGGATWQRRVDPVSHPELMGCPKTGVAFSTATNGWLTGSCPGQQANLFFYNTLDGGQTWQPRQLRPPANQPAGLFANGAPGCGLPGLVYASARSILVTVRCTFADANKTVAWLYAGKDNQLPEARYVPTPYGAFSFINAQEGWMVGAWRDDPATPGEIYHTVDGGQSWKLVISTAWQGIPDFVDAETGWVVARIADKSALVFTADGGKSWTQLNPRVGK
jgi:photosystem II stability/assembly factor-like uncharacterized protein